MMSEIKSLKSIPIDKIYVAHREAFKDYPFQWSKAALLNMLHRRGFNQELSFGAFEDDLLVSFTLNGIGDFTGKKSAYDTSTGTIEAYRGQGLASRIFEYSVPFLKKEGIQQYILEVLEENEKAISVYSKQVFSISRKFDCFKANTKDWNFDCNNHDEVELREIDFSDHPKMESMTDFNISWQNNFQALLKKPDHFICIGAFHLNLLVGYGIIEPETGDIPQLAVNKSFRRRGIGSMLLAKLKALNKADIVKIINIESNQEAVIQFITKNGIPKIISQIEMKKQL